MSKSHSRIKNLQTKRNKIKQKLIRWGMPLDEVELCMAQIKQRQFAKLNGKLDKDAPLCTRASYVKYLRQNCINPTKEGQPALFLGDDYVAPSDKGYKPPHVDSIKTGVGRATGATAKAVSRTKATTKYEYDRDFNDQGIY